MQLQDLMVEPLPAVADHASLKQAALLMGERDLLVLAVLRGPEIIGTLSQRDLVTDGCAKGRTPQETSVSEVMTRGVVSCPLDADLGTALSLLEENRAEALLVHAASGQVVGLLDRLRLLDALAHADVEAHGPLPEYVRRVQGNPT
jgi:CBS domain-containing protein